MEALREDERPEPLVYTMQVATKLLQLSPNTLYIMRREGKLRTVTIAGRIRVPAEEIARLLREGDGSEVTRGDNMKPENKLARKKG
ncbi:MAG: helix-turn-helix domain-containing protein [Methylocella sp.]